MEVLISGGEDSAGASLLCSDMSTQPQLSVCSWGRLGGGEGNAGGGVGGGGGIFRLK